MTVYYTKEHEWIRVDGDTATVGITDFAQGQLGDVVFVEVPEAGTPGRAGRRGGGGRIGQGRVATSTRRSAATVIEGNAALDDDPSLVNSDRRRRGLVLQAATLSDNHELDRGLMSADDYQGVLRRASEPSTSPRAGRRPTMPSNAAFVPALGAPALALLDPQPGEAILDLGCGDGVLTEAIARGRRDA